MWLAPNMVTTLGCFMLIANFFLVWHFDPHFDTPIPKWVFFVNGWFEFWYVATQTFEHPVGATTRTYEHF